MNQVISKKCHCELTSKSLYGGTVNSKSPVPTAFPQTILLVLFYLTYTSPLDRLWLFTWSDLQSFTVNSSVNVDGIVGGFGLFLIVFARFTWPAERRRTYSLVGRVFNVVFQQFELSSSKRLVWLRMISNDVSRPLEDSCSRDTETRLEVLGKRRSIHGRKTYTSVTDRDSV